MSGILDLLNSDLGKQIISGVSNETGAPKNKTADVLSMAMPVLMGAMQRNAASPQGAQGLLGALSDDRHSGGILDNLGDFFGGGVDSSALSDGEGILGHILGAKKPSVENALSQKSGLDAGTVSQILKIAAPILMGYLGKQTRKQNVNSTNDLGGLLGSVLGGSNSGGNQSLLTSILDADGDGSIIDDVAGMVLGGGKKKSGLGGMLGGLFGKR